MKLGFRSRRRGAAAATLAAAVAALALTACGSGDNSASSGSISGQSITLYSGQHEQTVDALVKDFHQRTGVTVNVRSGDEAELANQIVQEGSASPADAYMAENPPALTMLDNKGLLAKVDAATLAAVPAADSSPKGDWVGVSAREAVFVYNTNLIQQSQLPTSVTDLASAGWRGKLGIAPSETDFTPVVTRMIAAHGVAATTTWLQGLKSNGKVYDSNEDLVAAVNRGEVAAAVIDHYYWYRLRDEQGAGNIHSALAYFPIGDPAALVTVSGAAVLGSGKHHAAAQAFLAYLVSKPAQQIIATSESYEYPLVPGIIDTRVTRPLAAAGPVDPAADLGDGSQALQLLQSVGLLS
jgi:iron(III) transport system substrate-binding protein